MCPLGNIIEERHAIDDFLNKPVIKNSVLFYGRQFTGYAGSKYTCGRCKRSLTMLEGHTEHCPCGLTYKVGGLTVLVTGPMVEKMEGC